MPIPELPKPPLGGWNGVLGTRGSLMLDVVFLAMFLVVPVMLWSLAQVRWHGRYDLHRRIQVALGSVLAIAILALEVDLRLHDWRQRAEPSRFWRDGPWNDAIDWSLLVHLAFAIPTPLIWALAQLQHLLT
jgi:putative membrane protein